MKSRWPSKIYLYPYSRFIFYLFRGLGRAAYRVKPSYRKDTGGLLPERYSTLAESIFDILTKPVGDKRYDYFLNVKFESCNFMIRPFILSDIIMVSGFYEQYVSNLLYVKQGDIFLDVGAYIGRYTIPIAKKVGSMGKVIAFEPNESSAEILDRNIALNNLSNVTVFRRPVGVKGREVIYRVSDRPMHSGIGLASKNPKFKLSREIKMESVALDEVVFGLGIEKIDWLKIDVEGFEVDVLNGARNIIKRGTPRIIIEVAPENIDAVRKIFAEEGFSLSQLFGSNYYAAKDLESRK